MTYSSGAFGEERARQLIESRGATVVARNYTCRFGKIDLIALDSNRLAFIEVRSRSRSNFGSALASVSPAKQQKVLMTLMISKGSVMREERSIKKNFLIARTSAHCLSLLQVI